jgi:predicted nicotinamide N-methyase
LRGLGYAVETKTYRIGTEDYRIRALRDRQQYWDPEGAAERLGISSASWPLFGLVWPAGLALADEMSRFAVAGRSVLEIGCGLGIASLVLRRRGADVTATDNHPLTAEFLRRNAELNDLPPSPSAACRGRARTVPSAASTSGRIMGFVRRDAGPAA